ncbi:hypothetical protein LUZ63_000545 [Rhynchospora breviuscula]|uniref:Receptor-like serine/threonine-protein kinase n=1 Tax=Rhynchospora breviuscula TaxID=2022672 RepID=A0A9Q0HW92_9POAL|nr:hypothetical protein LUZ63_000545 [Rhynchospora breviuscula]
MARREFFIATFLLNFIIINGSDPTAGNILKADEMLLDNQVLNSTNGIFQLGFFNIKNSKNRYLGIWYTNPYKTMVWIANSDHPIIGGTGMLYLSPDGTLSIQNNTGQNIWSIGSQQSRGVPQACLLDSGLLVINDTKTGKILWQSLYQLSDTLLPHVPLGYTKFLDSMLEIQISSWNITGIDPSPGQYVRKLDPSRLYELVTFRGSDIIYRTGPWDGERWNGFPKMNQDMVKFVVTAGENGAYFWYEPQDPSILWRWVLKSNGTTYRYYLNGSDWVEYWKAPDESTPSYAVCGPYGINFDGDCKCCMDDPFHPKNGKDWKNRIFSEGCERNVPLNGTNHGFVTLRHVKLPDTINAVSDGEKSRSECERWCQKNLSCMAYAYIRWQGCLAWLGEIIDMEQFLDGGDTLYIRVASKRHNRKLVLIIVPLSIVVVLILVVILVRKKIWWLFRKYRPAAVEQETYATNGQEDIRFFEFFDFDTIKVATNNFSATNIIGEGQLGPVYKGVLQNGETIAVKKLSRSAPNGNKQLRNELQLLARLKHRNLVKLTGFCIQQQEIILCFELMQNSLDQLLFGTRHREEVLELNWEQRSRLIQGTASGLLYLHEENGDTIIHRDVKASNILLDQKMNPKIADLGISKLFQEDRSVFTVSTFGGTRGYIAPEQQHGMMSTKSDVYSFGMVILEIIRGKRNTSYPSGLVSLVLRYLNEGRILELKDTRLRGPWSDGELKRCIHIALLCLLEEPHMRPSMRQINLWLTCQSIELPPLPDQASSWGNIVMDPLTSVYSSALL